MRFARCPRTGYIVTDRERAAAWRRQRREREAFPLLAPMIAEVQPSIEQVMEDRLRRWSEMEQERRNHRARKWHEARRRLGAQAEPARSALLRYRNEHRWLPADPVYLLDTLHSFETGRLLLVDGAIRPARICISVDEAVAGFAACRKRAIKGWFG